MTSRGAEVLLLTADIISYAMFGAAAVVMPTLLVCTAPYGRYGRGGWGVGIPARLAWMTQELPSLLITASMLAHSTSNGSAPRGLQAVAIFTFMIHYTWRSLAFPLVMSSSSRTPLSVWLLAFLFCCCNGVQQGVSCVTRDWKPRGSIPAAVSAFGGLLWASGFAINVHADLTLCRMRKLSGSGYGVPRGGAFEWVSAANYFGEIVEWAGWAMLCQTLAATAFACFTFANLAPRGHTHHRFYLSKFKNYPSDRRAVIPYVW